MDLRSSFLPLFPSNRSSGNGWTGGEDVGSSSPRISRMVDTGVVQELGVSGSGGRGRGRQGQA